MDSTKTFTKEEFENIVYLKDQCLNTRRLYPHLTLRDILVNSCPHEVAYGTKLSKNMAYNTIYIDEEIGCPLCRKPSNLFLPVYSRSVFSALHPLQPSTVDLASFVAGLESGSAAWSSMDVYAKDAKEVIRQQRGLVETLANQAVSNEILFEDNAKEAGVGYEQGVGRFHKLIARGIAQLLRYTEINSLANNIKSYSEIYHNLYISFRLMLLMDWTESNTLFISSDTPSKLSKYTRIRSSLISILVESSPNGPSFIEANLDDLFSKLLTKLVIPF